MPATYWTPDEPADDHDDLAPLREHVDEQIIAPPPGKVDLVGHRSAVGGVGRIGSLGSPAAIAVRTPWCSG